MGEELKCPSCGQLMEKGFVQAPKGLYWDDKKHHWQVFESDELIDYLSLTMPNKESYRCQNCKLVVIRY